MDAQITYGSDAASPARSASGAILKRKWWQRWEYLNWHPRVRRPAAVRWARGNAGLGTRAFAGLPPEATW